MALQGIFFGAHQGNDVGPGESEGMLDASGEIRGATAHSVIDQAVVAVDARISGPAAETFTEKFVTNPSRSKSGLERLAIELRETEAGGPAADVAKSSDAVSGQDGEKIGNFEIRMADGKEKIGLGGVGIHEGYARGKAYSAGTQERRQVRQRASRVCILPAKPCGGRRMKASP